MQFYEEMLITLTCHLVIDNLRSLNETVSDKILVTCNNNPPNSISFMSGIPSTSWRLHSEFVSLYFYWFIGKLTAFLQILLH